MTYKITRSKKEVEKVLTKVRKLNPHWLEFFHGAVKEHIESNTPIEKIVRREYRRVRSEIAITKEDEKATVQFLVNLAYTHYKHDLSA